MQIASFFISSKLMFHYQLVYQSPTKLIFYPTCIHIQKDNTEVVKR